MAYAWHHVKVSMQLEMSAMIIAYCFLYSTCFHACSVVKKAFISLNQNICAYLNSDAVSVGFTLLMQIDFAY